MGVKIPGGFLNHGGTPKSSIYWWIFHDKPSSYWGYPHDFGNHMEPPSDDPIKFRQNLCGEHGEQLQAPSDSPTFAWKANGAWTAAFARLPWGVHGQKWGETANMVICFKCGYGTIPMKIPFLGEWTSINPSYFDVNYRGTIGFDTLPCGYHMIEWDMDGLSSYDWELSIKCRDFANMGWAPKLCTSISGQTPFMTHFRQS